MGTETNTTSTMEKSVREPVDGALDGFFWQDYLDATESVEVPQIMFSHVEDTLQNEIEIGMGIEVPIKFMNPDQKEEKFWIATVAMVCGPLLRLRYFGTDDRSLDFWFNLTKESGHELGWTKNNSKVLEPPQAVLDKFPDWREHLDKFYSETKSIPSEMLSGDGLSIIDRIKVGTKVEVNDVRHPHKLWIATIKENVGGRLLLEYDTPNISTQSIWIFCTSERLHSYGFSSQTETSDHFLEPPSCIVDKYSYEEWKELSENVSKEHLKETENLFNNARDHQKHSFKLGMKLETVSPGDRSRLCPATIIKIFNDNYFLVKIDTYSQSEKPSSIESCSSEVQEENTWLCTSEHPYIFPSGWAEKHGLDLASPKGWTSKSEKFIWKDYLDATKALAAPEDLFEPRESAADAGLESGMRLETVDPENENVVCAAHITKVVENLLWLKLDCYDDTRPEHIVHMRSLHIFPVGWCESNHYPLMPPKDYIETCYKTRGNGDKSETKEPGSEIPREPKSSCWCPKIYFNFRCCTGPMISKGKLATLPKSVGPGPVILVMREVLSMIVSVGYRSARILKVLQCDTTKMEPGYHLEVLKAKHKSNSYRANVAVITSGEMVTDFCKDICKKLLVCPNLFGPEYVEENKCPAECHKPSVARLISSGAWAKGKSIYVAKPGPWAGRRKKRRGRWAIRENKDENNDTSQNNNEPPIKKEDEDMYDESQDMENEEKDVKSVLAKTEVLSSNVSEDSRSSSNDRKSKDSNVGSPESSSGKNTKSSQEVKKRSHDYDSDAESGSEGDEEDLMEKHKSRRPKTRKLESNPLYWTKEDVFRYLRKTTDCKDLAYRVKQEEIDGLAFLLLNLPSLTQHMKLRTAAAMKLCRHVEQVKVTFFLKHINNEGN